MSPPILPDFPLLTTTATGTGPPSPPHTPTLRDPRTGTAISPCTSSEADRVRQRLKLVRLGHTVTDPLFVRNHVAAVIARREVRYAAFHAERQLERQKAREERLRRWFGPDPYAAWDTPPILPAEVFYRPPVPASVALVSGIPNLAWGYGAVCMSHGLREDLNRPGRTIPVFAREVKNDMGVLEKFDPVRRPARTDRFDVARFERAVALESQNGKRDRGQCCLRCRIKGLPCSFERMRGRERARCEGCRRNACKLCVGVWHPRDGLKTGYRYLRVKKTGALGKAEMVVFVKIEGEVDVSEVRTYAEELMDAKGVGFLGTTLDRGAMLLPDWQETYCKSLALKRGLDREFVEGWTGEEVPHDADAADMEAVTWKDYFQLLDERWRLRHPYQRREPKRLLPGEEPCLP